MTYEEFDEMMARDFEGEEMISVPVCKYCPYGNCVRCLGWGCNRAPWENKSCPKEAYIDIPERLCSPETNEWVEKYFDYIEG